MTVNSVSPPLVNPNFVVFSRRLRVSVSRRAAFRSWRNAPATLHLKRASTQSKSSGGVASVVQALGVFIRVVVLVALCACVDAACLSPVLAQGSVSDLPYRDLVEDAAARHRVDPLLVHAVIAVESAHRRDAVSPAGAEGLMQLMPRTARMLGVSDPFDPRENVEAGVAYLRRLHDEFGTVLALAAYNAGPGAVREHGGVPPFAETRGYVRSVLLALIRLRAGFPAR